MIWVLAVVLVGWIACGPVVLVIAAALLVVPRVRWWVQDRAAFNGRRVVQVGAALVVVAGLVVVVPDGWLPIPPAPGVFAGPSYVGRPATARPVAAQPVPQHPHLAPAGRATTDLDGGASDAYTWAGPLGSQPDVDTASYGLERCSPLVVDADDRLVGVCRARSGPALRVIDPESMRKVAGMELPDRDSAADGACADTSLYLDAAGRAVLTTQDRQVLAVRIADGEADLETEETWDLRPYVPAGDCLVAVLPDWSGRIWWTSHAGLVGTIAPDSGETRVLDLDETLVQSLAVDETGGVYVVTDKSLHRLSADADGTPVVTWRTAYDRGEERKPGQRSRGSGTTPTLIDHGIIAIADNAEPRANVVFLDRESGRKLCTQPVFGEGESATDVSLASVGSGVVVTNTYGYTSPWRTMLGRVTAPGIARVDLVSGQCKLRWTSDQVSPSSGTKVSWATGLAYAWTKRRSWTGVSAWYATAIDVESGRAMWSVRTGTGMLADNDGSAITLAPDGSVYMGTLGGLIRVRDRR